MWVHNRLERASPGIVDDYRNAMGSKVPGSVEAWTALFDQQFHLYLNVGKNRKSRDILRNLYKMTKMAMNGMKYKKQVPTSSSKYSTRKSPRRSKSTSDDHGDGSENNDVVTNTLPQHHEIENGNNFMDQEPLRHDESTNSDAFDFDLETDDPWIFNEQLHDESDDKKNNNKEG